MHSDWSIMQNVNKRSDWLTLFALVHRIGKNVSRSQPRAIIAKFSNFKTCSEIIKEKKRLMGSKIYVREDFSDKIMAKRRDLLPKMHEARRNELTAYIRYDKLVTCSKVNN